MGSPDPCDVGPKQCTQSGSQSCGSSTSDELTIQIAASMMKPVGPDECTPTKPVCTEVTSRAKLLSHQKRLNSTTSSSSSNYNLNQQLQPQILSVNESMLIESDPIIQSQQHHQVTAANYSTTYHASQGPNHRQQNNSNNQQHHHQQQQQQRQQTSANMFLFTKFDALYQYLKSMPDDISVCDELRSYQFWKCVRTEFLISLLFVTLTTQLLITTTYYYYHYNSTVSSNLFNSKQPTSTNAIHIPPTTTNDSQPSSSSLLLSALFNGLLQAFTVASLTQIFGNISGAHIVPSISFALLVRRHITSMRFTCYLLAQLLGSLFGVFLLWTLSASIVVEHDVSSIMQSSPMASPLNDLARMASSPVQTMATYSSNSNGINMYDKYNQDFSHHIRFLRAKRSDSNDSLPLTRFTNEMLTVRDSSNDIRHPQQHQKHQQQQQLDQQMTSTTTVIPTTTISNQVGVGSELILLSIMDQLHNSAKKRRRSNPSEMTTTTSSIVNPEQQQHSGQWLPAGSSDTGGQRRRGRKVVVLRLPSSSISKAADSRNEPSVSSNVAHVSHVSINNNDADNNNNNSNEDRLEYKVGTGKLSGTTINVEDSRIRRKRRFIGGNSLPEGHHSVSWSGASTIPALAGGYEGNHVIISMIDYALPPASPTKFLMDPVASVVAASIRTPSSTSNTNSTPSYLVSDINSINKGTDTVLPAIALVNTSQLFGFQFLATLLIVLTYLANVEPRRQDLGYKSLSIGLAYFVGYAFTSLSGGLYAHPFQLVSLALIAQRWSSRWCVYLITPFIGGLFAAFTYEYIDFTSVNNRNKSHSLRRSFHDNDTDHLDHHHHHHQIIVMDDTSNSHSEIQLMEQQKYTNYMTDRRLSTTATTPIHNSCAAVSSHRNTPNGVHSTQRYKVKKSTRGHIKQASSISSIDTASRTDLELSPFGSPAHFNAGPITLNHKVDSNNNNKKNNKNSNNSVNILPNGQTIAKAAGPTKKTGGTARLSNLRQSNFDENFIISDHRPTDGTTSHCEAPPSLSQSALVVPFLGQSANTAINY